MFSVQFTELFYSLSVSVKVGGLVGNSVAEAASRVMTRTGSYVCLSTSKLLLAKVLSLRAYCLVVTRTSSFVHLCQQASSIAKCHGFATLRRGAVWSGGLLTLPWQPAYLTW